MNIFVIGLGLMGGSLCRALSARTENEVYGYDLNPATCRLALDTGAVKEILPPENAADMDVCCVALFPQKCADMLNLVIPLMKSGAVATDLCGIKNVLVRQVKRRADVPYISAHPMAGREVAGFEHSLETLYDGASLLLTPDEDTPEWALERLQSIFSPCGFKRMIETTPEQHDRMIAYTSQLAHVVSAAYILSPTALKHIGYSAGSFRDLTRVAKLNPDMWTELFLDNSDDLVAEIDEIIKNLSAFRTSIATTDRTTLHELLSESNSRKLYLNERESEQ